MDTVEANCHCGEIRITVPDTSKDITSCNCSACAKYAALWAYFTPKDVNISAQPNSLSSYCWGK